RLNSSSSGGPYDFRIRFQLSSPRAMVTAILSGSLARASYATAPVFGLHIPGTVSGVPSEVLNPRNTWKDREAYDVKARELAKRFRENDAKFDLPDAVRAAGPKA